MNELRKRVGESLRVSGPVWTGSLILERVLRVNLLGRWPVRRVPVERLRGQVIAILGAWGMPEEEAATTAGHLIYPDLCGIDSHGVAMLLHYQRELGDGSLSDCSRRRGRAEGAATALVDGGGGLGHVPADLAMRMAIAKARETGVAAVAVRSSGHFGAAGSYAAMAVGGRADRHGDHQRARARRRADSAPTPMLGTNPIAFAAPAGLATHFLLDMATSTASLGKVRPAWRNGRAIPAGWALDVDGAPVEERARSRRHSAG